MTRSTVNVTFSRASSEEIPEHLNRGVLLLLRLSELGVLDAVEQRLKIPRQSGYNGVHLFIVAVLALMSGSRAGLQTFRDQMGAHETKIAALLGFKSLPAASSIARLLGDLPATLVDDFCSWLLEGSADLTLLSSPAVTTRDCRGDPWHVFDYDPTVETLLRRPLAHPADAPTPVRRSEELAAPGYTGRKRGDVRIRRFACAHAGSGLWRFMDMDNGKGDGRVPLDRALASARATVDQVASEARVVVRLDGEFGNVPALKIAEKNHVKVLCRLPRYQLLEREEVQARLNEGRWWPVDNCSGFPRYAAEIGWLNLYASERTPQCEEEAGKSVPLRVIAVRSPCLGEAGRGVKIGAEQVELFATTLDEGSWPTAEVIALYQGRSALENRFAQEDREFRLDRIFSYHLPGQKWMTAVGMFLWNCEIALGVDLSPLPTTIATPATPRGGQLAHDLPLLFPPKPGVFPSDSITREPPQVTPSAPPALGPSVASAPAPPDSPEVDLIDALESQLDAAHWDSLPPGWRRHRGTLTLCCPQDKKLKLYYIEHEALPRNGKRKRLNRAGYRTELGACDGCPMHLECRGKARPHSYKFLNKMLPPKAAHQAHRLFAQRASMVPPHRAPPRAPHRARTRSGHPTATPGLHRPLPLVHPQVLLDPGPWAVQPSTFCPARARHTWAERVRDLRLQIHLPPYEIPTEPPPHPLLQDRQRHPMPSVQTWKARLARYDLPHGVAVTLRIVSRRDDVAKILAFRGEDSRRMAS